MFGANSSNKDNILVFIAMLKSLRFTYDHEELVSTLHSSMWAQTLFDQLKSIVDVQNTAVFFKSGTVLHI